MLENVGACPPVVGKLLPESATTKVSNCYGLERVQGFAEKEILPR